MFDGLIAGIGEDKERREGENEQKYPPQFPQTAYE
jgi:hypothetical protein